MPVTLEQDPIINVMIEAALAAARTAINLRAQAKLDAIRQQDTSWFTAADHEAQVVIEKTLKKTPIQATFIGEEAPESIVRNWESGGRQGLAWVVDPIDGTFVFKPDKEGKWCVSIALQENGQTTHSVIYEAGEFDRDANQLKGKLYIAKTGQGVRVSEPVGNGNSIVFKELRANKAPEKVISIGIYSPDCAPESPYHKGEVYQAMKVHCEGKGYGIVDRVPPIVSMLGTINGDFAGYNHGRHKPWDSAAATHIVHEAGGLVSEVQDTVAPGHSIVICSPQQSVFNDLANVLKRHNVTPSANPITLQAKAANR